MTGLLFLIFMASSSQVFAKEKTKQGIGGKGPSGGYVIVAGAKLKNIEVSKGNLKGHYTWSDAIQACKNSREGGFRNWVLPSTEIFHLMCQKSTVIGGFADDDTFWTSSAEGGYSAWWRRISKNENRNCDGNIMSKDYESSVRCVRSF